MFILKLQTLMLRNRPVLLKRRGSHTAFTDQQTFTTMKPLQPNKNKIIQNACLRELVDAVFVFLYIISTHTLLCMYQYRRQKKCAQLFSGTTSLLLFLKKYPIRLYYQAFSMRRSVQKIMQKTVRRVGANVGDVTTFSCKFSLLLPNFLSMEVFSSSKLMYCADTTIFYSLKRRQFIKNLSPHASCANTLCWVDFSPFILPLSFSAATSTQQQSDDIFTCSSW